MDPPAGAEEAPCVTGRPDPARRHATARATLHGRAPRGTRSAGRDGARGGDYAARMTDSFLQGITHTIQLAVAPVFLLTALGTTLSVLTTRLSRIVDRARRVEARLPGEAGESREGSVRELGMIAGRVRLIYWALTLGTTAALLVCLLIAVAFVGYLFDMGVGTAMALLFVAAMAAYVGALVCFLREVFIAIATIRFGLPPEVREGGDPAGA